jgi:23S rRNA (uracil1939-C5)-methyltransferase
MSSLRTGSKAQLTIDSLVSGGDGLARHAGPEGQLPIFVARTAPGDIVEVEIFDARKDFARGRAVKMVEPSTQRVEPLCKLFKVCGGCQWQHISYEAQLQYKQDVVKEAIKRIGKLSVDMADMVRETIGAKEPFYYRNRVQMPVKNPARSTRMLAGYYEQDSHDLVNIKHCPVQPAAFDELLEQVKQQCEEHEITAYNEHTQTGVLRHICMRQGADGLLLCLVVNMKPKQIPPADLQAMARALESRNPNLVGTCINYNNEPGNRIYGGVTQGLVGQDFITQHLESHISSAPEILQTGLDFKVSATSFFQINNAQTVVMLDLILEAVLAGNAASLPSSQAPIVIDAYAGVGTIALWLAPLASRVIAIEESPDSAADIIENIKLNGMTNVDFHHAQVEEVLPQLHAQGIQPDILILDPPRKGVTKTVIESTLKLQPAKIIYVSCNPATLARDLNELSQKYNVKSIQPVDMFPQTFHIESISILEKIGS